MKDCPPPPLNMRVSSVIDRPSVVAFAVAQAHLIKDISNIGKRSLIKASYFQHRPIISIEELIAHICRILPRGCDQSSRVLLRTLAMQ